MAEKTPPRSAEKRRRKSLTADSDSRQISRPLLVAMLVILAGAAYLFWPRGNSMPSGIGEQYSIVTADSSVHATPRSGSVDIGREHSELVPEQPTAGAADEPDADREPLTLPDTAASAPAREETQPTQPAQQARPRPTRQEPEPAPRIEPLRRGPWAVQLGAYQDEENANALVERLATKDILAQVRSASTSTGEIIHRVWIGWFRSRADAQAYARQERGRLGEAYPVHR